MDENRISDMALEYANSHGGEAFACIALALAYEQGAKDVIEIIKKEGITC